MWYNEQPQRLLLLLCHLTILCKTTSQYVQLEYKTTLDNYVKATLWPEVSTFTVLRQDVRARSLEVKHAAIEGAIMRITEGDAGSRTGKTMRTTQTWNDCKHLILRWTQTHRTSCTETSSWKHEQTMKTTRGELMRLFDISDKTVCVVILTAAQVRGGQRSLLQCTSPDTHVQLVHSSTSHCSLEWYTTPWNKHESPESVTQKY